MQCIGYAGRAALDREHFLGFVIQAHWHLPASLEPVPDFDTISRTWGRKMMEY
jgi:hypothetical protein